jgi:hypothetical protein
VLITDNSHTPRLPFPSNDLPSVILSNVDFLLKPKLRRNVLHQENGLGCHCVMWECVNNFHRPAVLYIALYKKQSENIFFLMINLFFLFLFCSYVYRI